MKRVANHIGPELCALYRKVLSEVLTGVHTGLVLSLENRWNSVPRQLSNVEGNKGYIVMARYVFTLRGRRPGARVETLCSGTRRSCLWSSGENWGTSWGNCKRCSP